MLLVGEVQRVAPHLLCLIPLGEKCRQPQQSPHGRGDGPQIVQMLRLRRVIGRGQLFQLRLALLHHRADGLFRRLVFLALYDAHPAEGGLHRRHGIPAAPGHLPVTPQTVSHLCKAVAVGVQHRRAVLHKVHHTLQLLRPKLGPAHRVRHHRLTVHAVRQMLRDVRPPLCRLGQPFLRVRVALELAVQLRDQPRQRPVIPSRAQGVRQQGVLPVAAFDGPVKVLQRGLQRPLPQQRRLTLVQHPEIRRQGIALPLLCQKMGVLPQQCRAEGVHGLDVRLIHPQKLAAEVSVLRGLRHPFGQFSGDLAPQLRRGGLGVGDDEEIIDIAAFLRHIAEKPVHQYLCLAGAGGGGHQQAAAPVLHRRLLLLRQFQLCHESPPPSSSSFQNSSGFTGRMYRRRSRSRPSRN